MCPSRFPAFCYQKSIVWTGALMRPDKIPTCNNVPVGACPRSDVVVAKEDNRHLSFFCRTCHGLQVFTKEDRPRPRPVQERN
jgi:hypothetical protein